MVLSLLCTVLMGTDAAPLKQVLLKSGLCKKVTAYMIDDYSEIPVVFKFKGCNPENAKKLEQLIQSTLKDIIEKDIPEDLIKNAIHQIEFYRSEITGDSYPYGLSLFLRAGLLEAHGGHAEDALLVHSLCDRLRQRIAEDPTYLKTMIQKYFLDNTHSACVVAHPDKEMAAKEMQEERETLNKIRADLKSEEEQKIVEKATALATFQDEQAHADLDVLPKVTLDDVPKKSRNYPLHIEQIGNVKVHCHDCFTNHIVYSSLIFPLPAIEEKELPLLKLFSLLMPQMGCGGRSYGDNLNYIQAHTGGVGATETLNLQAHDFNALHPYFLVEGKALDRKAEKLFPLLHEMATSTDFTDIPRLKEVIIKHFTGLQSTINQNALGYAMHLAASNLDIASRIGNAWRGLEYYHFIKEIAEHFDEQANQLVKTLQNLQDRILCLQDPHMVITCDREMYEKLKENKLYGLQDITTKDYQPWKSDYTLQDVPQQGRVIATPVAFTAKTFKSLPYIHPETPALNVAAHLFDNLTLHPRIREQGGAYGGGAMNGALSGSFCFYAYRDPNIASSLAAFDEAVLNVLNGDFKESDLEEAKLEIIQGLDSPVAPGSRGHVAYAWLREGKTLELRQNFRDRLLALTRDDIITAVQAHIKDQSTRGNTVVFAGQDLLERENDILICQGKTPLQINKV